MDERLSILERTQFQSNEENTWERSGHSLKSICAKPPISI
jgi:hypothetical protein